MEIVNSEAVDKGIIELCNAVIIQACKDYYGKKTRISRNSIEEFFRSSWFVELSRGCMSGQAIISHLRETAEKNPDVNGSIVFYRIKEGKAPNGEKELRWNLSESAKRRQMAESLSVGHDAGRVGSNSES